MIHTSNTIMCAKLDFVSFKNSASGKTISIMLDVNMPLKSLRDSVNDKIISALNVRENYKIINIHQRLFEFDSNIDETSELSISDISEGYLFGFYITPNSFYSSNSVTNCSVCLDKFIYCKQKKFTCGHDKNICNGCISGWIDSCNKSGKTQNCPLCRREI